MMAKDSKSNPSQTRPRPRPEEVEKTPAESIKETIDSIIVAFCLAFVFRAFIVEAFVIPTGSMADTLLGMHRQYTCESCGYTFDVGIQGSVTTLEAIQQLQSGGREVRCPHCGWALETQVGSEADRERPNLGGDKILVLKYPYLFSTPRRWDVVVFYNPALPSDNYIKRLIGRPGESVQIVDGDIFVGDANDPSKPMRIARKPDRVQDVLWRPVFHEDSRPIYKMSADRQVPQWVPEAADNGWTTSGRVFTYRPMASGNSSIRFHSLGEEVMEAAVPTPGDLNLKYRPLGFVDYYAYNRYPRDEVEWRQLNIVRDLKLEAVVFFTDPNAKGVLRMSMNRRNHRFIAEFRQDGTAELIQQTTDLTGVTTKRVIGSWPGGGRATPLPTDRGVRVRLQNVDFQASLWIDGRKLIWTRDDDYGPDGPVGPSLEDLRRLDEQKSEGGLADRHLPGVWIEASGGPLDLAHVNLDRDVYYSAYTEGREHTAVDRGTPLSPSGSQIMRLRGTTGHPSDYDEFFMLGDNSPASYDGRKWEINEPDLMSYWHLRSRIPESEKGKAPNDVAEPYRFGTVPRDHLIGRAFFVYWPAGLQMFNSRLHLVPNVGKMRLIN
ncbi:MAG: hypothetical protein BIFFINMI_03744 [Phycisphaerae bacterium]|nr:hypothetical protein [Phycisphaerae bacterium]